MKQLKLFESETRWAEIRRKLKTESPKEYDKLPEIPMIKDILKVIKRG